MIPSIAPAAIPSKTKADVFLSDHACPAQMPKARGRRCSKKSKNKKGVRKEGCATATKPIDINAAIRIKLISIGGTAPANTTANITCPHGGDAVDSLAITACVLL